MALASATDHVATRLESLGYDVKRRGFSQGEVIANPRHQHRAVERLGQIVGDHLAADGAAPEQGDPHGAEVGVHVVGKRAGDGARAEGRAAQRIGPGGGAPVTNPAFTVLTPRPPGRPCAPGLRRR